MENKEAIQLNVEYNIEAINDAINRLTDIRNQLKEYRSEINNDIETLATFIEENYKFNHGATFVIKANDLRLSYCNYLGVTDKDITARAFGLLISKYIDNPEYNKHNICRKAIRTGTAYAGLKHK